MVKKKLVEGLISDGAKLLRELDRENFLVESMFWIHLPDDDYWRLVIASPNVDKEGVAAGYGRINQILRNIETAGLTLGDISLLDPDSRQFQSLRSLAAGSGRLAAGAAWVEFEDAIIYRWTSEYISADLNCDVSESELIRLWDAERKASGEPALLITSAGRRITLRFHPRHGPLPGLKNIQEAFQIALHRPNARPDCKVSWIG